MGQKNRKPLNKEQGERVLQLLKSVPEWAPTEIPLKEMSSIPGLVRSEDTFSLWISGSSSNPQLAHALRNIIVGIDQLVHETKPKLDKNEPAGNAYHYVIQKIDYEEYPYILYGPFVEGTRIPHWFDDSDLDDAYWNTGEDE